ncbi:hypothetical protein CR513_16985, partial [Mucuna pruriens]
MGFQIIRENYVVDSLSRVMAVQSVSLIINEDLSMVAEETIGDPYLRNDKLVLSTQSARISTILTKFQSSQWGGHLRIMRAYKMVAIVFY